MLDLSLAERVAALNARYRNHAAVQVLRHALADPDLGRVALVSSFGAESVVLLHLLSVTAPGLFPSPQRFSQFYRRAIERDHDTDKLRQLQRRVRPFLLRRTKQAVAADLPPKQEQVVEV